MRCPASPVGGEKEMTEHQTEWEHKDKMWTYLIFAFLLVAIVLVVNLVWKNPQAAEQGVKHFFGLPGWLLASITAVLGILIFWLGLKMEPDGPEAVGALLVAGASAWFELSVGWHRFDC